MMLLNSCHTEVNPEKIQGSEEMFIGKMIAQTEDISKIEYLAYSKDFRNFHLAQEYFSELDIEVHTKANSTKDLELSNEVMITLNRLENVMIEEDESLEDCRIKLLNILNSGPLEKDSKEYQAIKIGIDATIAVCNYKMQMETYKAVTKGFWNSAWNVIKCVGGTAGSAGLGAIAGAAVGTVTLPLVGTVSGTALGGWSGALVGVASFC